MDIGTTVVNQVAMMFGLMAIGTLLYRRKMLTDQGTEQMASVLINIVIPAVIISSFNIEFNASTLWELGLVFGLACVSMGLGLGIAWLMYGSSHKLEQFAITFSNVGFFGVPLVLGLLGPSYVIYLSAYILAFNVLVWSVGIYLITQQNSAMKLRTFIQTPAFISLVLGLLVFVSPIKLSGFIAQGFSLMSGLNTPLAMLVLGTYLAKSPLKAIFTDAHGYRVALARLIINPVAVMILLFFIPGLRSELKMIVLIASSTPIATIMAIFSQLYGDDYAYGARLISLTNLLSMVTIPILITLGSYLF